MTLRFNFTSTHQFGGRDELSVAKNFDAEVLDDIFAEFAQFLRSSGFEYVRYLGRDDDDNFIFDKNQHDEYRSDNMVNLEDVLVDLEVTMTPFLKKASKKKSG